jgi:hypothetical protein
VYCPAHAHALKLGAVLLPPGPDIKFNYIKRPLSVRLWEWTKHAFVGTCLMAFILAAAISGILILLGAVNDQWDAVALGSVLFLVFAFAGWKFYNQLMDMIE